MAEGDPTLRVPTQTVRVEVAFPSATPRAVALFSPPGAVERAARVRVAELLDRDPRFLPARDAASGDLVTLGVRSIAWIGVAIERSEDILDDDDLFEHRRDVQIEIVDGSLLEGELMYSAPASGTRIVDVLNSGRRFLPLWLTDRVLFVNKTKVRRVTEVPHVHRPTMVAPPPKAPSAVKPKKKRSR